MNSLGLSFWTPPPTGGSSIFSPPNPQDKRPRRV
jgi:hypothetical protein